MANEIENDGPKVGGKESESSGLGYLSVQGVQGSRGYRGSKIRSDQEGDSGGKVGEGPSELRDPLRDRHHARIPGTRSVDPSETLLQAFLEGDFEKAYQSALELKTAYHEALVEASHQRFLVNFGTEICSNCDGLKAGPGVVATCFQVKRCNFTSVYEGSESPYHLRILDRLSLK